MDDLIARLEKLNGPDRGADADIALAVGPWTERHGLPEGGWVSKGPHHAIVAAPEFTKSIDVAMELVPEGMWWSVQTCNTDGEFFGSAACGTRDEDGHPFDASTPAIALVIAALRARKALTENRSK